MACGATLKRSHEFDSLHSPGSPKRRKYVMPISTPPAKQTKSQFFDASPKLTSEQIASRISMELKRMHRRRQLHYQGQDNVENQNSPQPSTSEQPACIGFDSSLHSNQNFTSPKKDIPLFTFRQVSMICDRMIKDREEQIQVQYDSILASKLAEQYEAFLRFNHDQLQKRFGDAPMSYVS
ncbi:hypothetical protein LOTGIDRAFT_222669 [Lottia gigantea]|uniref:Akirin n=1 Tax=Lottia gigantea TaxID=225164 RepID=V3ZLY9_LOTGI|nr:hypothetical protein LOTGIDRAFT_222669 [Lottia gigantea]ESO83440.1 hypothetical protein LOTGIDRAFT_222669 [Lottia gigantea]